MFISYSFILYYFCILPAHRLPISLMVANDKLMHSLNFFILTLIAFRTFAHSRFPLVREGAVEKAAGFALFFSTFVEWMQKNSSGRTVSLADWAANALGIFLAFLICRITEHPRVSRLPLSANP